MDKTAIFVIGTVVICITFVSLYLAMIAFYPGDRS